MITGHGIVLPTGSEVNNVIRNNLIVGILKPTVKNNNDGTVETPSAILISNPSNSLTLNVIAGVDGNGINYDIKERADGVAYGDDFCPDGMKVTALKDNVIHSCSQTALIIKNMVPRTRPCLPPRNLGASDIWAANPPIATELSNFTIYAAKNGILVDNIGSVSFKLFSVADIKVASIEFKETINSQNLVKIENTTFFGRAIVNSLSNANTEPNFIKTSENNGLELNSVRFSHPVSNMIAIKNCDNCRQPISVTVDFNTHSFTNMFTDGVKMINWGTKMRTFVHDLTGKFTAWYIDGVGNRTSTVLVPYARHLDLKNECNNATTLSISSSWHNSLVCTTGSKARMVTISRANPKDVRDGFSQNIRVIRVDPTMANLCNNFSDIASDNQRWDVPLLIGKTYNLTWPTQADFKNFSILPSSYR